MEALAVVRRVTVPDDGFYMFLRRISHVPFPSVLRIFLCQPPHMIVPVCLCEDGGRCNRREFSVSLDDALIAVVIKWLESVAVYKQKFRLYSEPSYGALHAGYGCIEYVYSIDFFCADLFDRPGYGFALDDGSERFPCLFRHLLRVVEQRVMEVLREYHCSGIYRAGQRASSGFVTPRFHEVFMKIAQKVIFIAHFAKIRNPLKFRKSIFPSAFQACL